MSIFLHVESVTLQLRATNLKFIIYVAIVGLLPKTERNFRSCEGGFVGTLWIPPPAYLPVSCQEVNNIRSTTLAWISRTCMAWHKTRGILIPQLHYVHLRDLLI